MAYIGTIPAEAYTSFAVQHFTTSATDTFTLDFPVANENEIALFINNVRQEPGSSYAYTASGTTLTLSSAITGSDSMYCVFIGKAVQTVTPAVGSVTNDMLAGSIANSKLANSSITLNGSAVSLGGSATVGGTNTPAFRAERSSAQSITDATYTKVQFDSENFDTDNCYDNTTNYRFTPNVAGKYFIYAQVSSYGGATDSLMEVNPAIRKNGSNVSRSSIGDVSTTDNFHVATSYLSVVLEMNGTTDYVEVFQYADATSTPNVQGSGFSYFGGYKIIE